jgi:hypothetical protein
MHNDPLWMKIFLGVHVSAGMLSFVLAPIALTTAKGGKQHKRWGMVYFWSMGVVAATALPMALFRPVLFLALVAGFSFYLTFAGYRILKLKGLASGGSAGPVDWIAACLGFAASACLAGFGFFNPAWVQNFRTVSIVIGLIGMRTTAADVYHFVRKPTEKMFWMYTHLAKFIGSYIAAWTAFSAVTLSQIFHHAGIILWLWPAAVGVPAIILTTAYYRRKFAPRKAQGKELHPVQLN